MHYQTLFLTYIGALTIFAGFAGVLALQSRKVVGLNWIAGSLLVGLIKVILQGLEGRVPTVLSSMVANELYLCAFVMQFLGLRWFVYRVPLKRRLAFAALGCLLLTYTVLYLCRIPYIANVINLPTLLLIGMTIWTLMRHGHSLFQGPSRWTSLFLFGEFLVSAYRAVLTNLDYALPWKVTSGQHDPRWLDSLMAMMFFSTCVFMCQLWFFVIELQSELIHLARTDPLTGALNRRALQTEAEREISRSLRYHYPLCALVLDIDEFKKINDSHGHAAGDLVLRGLVSAVLRLLRAQDGVARSGGEEVTILLPQTTCEGGITVAERIRSALEAMELTTEAISLRFSVSIGVAELEPHNPSFDRLIRHADQAMYQAKRLGRNHVVCYEEANRLASTPDILPTTP
jgi:diguanylate cyclase (GGDEF)-like protein